jgi:flagellar biosynthesis protein FlhF
LEHDDGALAPDRQGDKEMAMKLRRFIGTDMRDCLRQVREALGPEAVILETTRSPAGVEIAAAIDAGSPAAAMALRDRESGGYDDESPGAAVVIGEARQGLGGYVPPRPAAAADASDYDRLREELASVRSLLEMQVTRLIWDDRTRRSPAKAGVLRKFAQLGLDADVAERLAGEASARDGSGNWTAVLRALGGALPLATTDCAAAGGIYAVVGPTGVGKTTTIAKLAARAALQWGPDSVGLVTADTFRVAAREQLGTYGQILGIPVHQAGNATELKAAITALKDRRLVLVDTAGMSQRDPRLTEQLARLAAAPAVAGRQVETLLALPANGDSRTLQEIADVFRTVAPVAGILTKTDEASSLGGALSVLIRSGLPLAYLTNGQRVPEDLHFMHDRQAWLTKMAVELIRRDPRVVSDDELARRHTEVATHAYA